MILLPEHNARRTEASKLSAADLALFYDGEWLSLYALACGYIERCVTDVSHISLSNDSPGSGVFHVRGLLGGEHYWETFEDVHSARRDFRRIIARKSFKNARRM